MVVDIDTIRRMIPQVIIGSFLSVEGIFRLHLTATAVNKVLLRHVFLILIGCINTWRNLIKLTENFHFSKVVRTIVAISSPFECAKLLDHDILSYHNIQIFIHDSIFRFPHFWQAWSE